MLRILAILFGIGFIFAGIAGFLPSFTTDERLFGLFEVNVMHNVLHLISGVIAIMAATRYQYAKWYFEVLGLFYAIIAILGFARDGNLFIMHTNIVDNIFNILIAVIALYLGFSAKKNTPNFRG